MSEIKFKIEELKSAPAGIGGVNITIGSILEDTWEEAMGPTPMPSINTLRTWDHILLNRYKPFYSPFCDMCCLCTYGKCDLTAGKIGACGIGIGAQQARMYLLSSCIGAATHGAHARHIVEHLIEKLGGDHKIDLGRFISVNAPNIMAVVGMRPERLGDLRKVLDYAEEQIVQCLSATHTGQEGSSIDFESKSMHMGMIDHVVMEAADIAQITGCEFPKGDPDAPLVEIGMGTLDRSKPVIICIGHNVVTGIEIVDYLIKKDMMDKLEVGGLCCTAHDITRYEKRAKVVGHLSKQLYFIRSGVADVIVVDEQCVRLDTLKEATKVKTSVIATSDKICYGLPDRTNDPRQEIIKDLANGAPGALILDPEKAGEVAVEVALRISEKRRKLKILPDKKEVIKLAEGCNVCGECKRTCPLDLPIPKAMKTAAKDDLSGLVYVYDMCLGCGVCESACRRDLPILNMIQRAAERKVKGEKYVLRSGRGPILDTEIRKVGPPIVLGTIPGVVAYVGCANYPKGRGALAEMAEEFLRRKYIVIASGCAAMDIAMHKDEDGKTLYEKYPGDFDAGCIANVGSCVANSHISGACIKISSIFARRNIRGNYEEIADYILNRIGACGVAWGAYSQKAEAIAVGCNRWGIPVIVGPHAAKYRRLYLGRKDIEDDWNVYDVKAKGDRVFVGPAPEHLMYASETKEECIVMTARLCIRPNDTTKGRMIKLSHYLDLSEKYFGTLPDDWPVFVRTEADLPIAKKDVLLKELKEMEWKPGRIPDPTNLERFKLKWR